MNFLIAIITYIQVLLGVCGKYCDISYTIFYKHLLLYMYLFYNLCFYMYHTEQWTLYVSIFPKKVIPNGIISYLSEKVTMIIPNARSVIFEMEITLE